MKSKLFRLFPILLLVGLVGISAAPAHAAKIKVVTTLTDLADLTRAVGGNLVEVRSLATGVEDTHGVPMKPSFVPMLNRADMVVVIGFGCEHAFLPALLEASKNPRIQPGKAGYLDCSVGITPLAVPKSTDHSEGDVHPYGNPHYMLDPMLARKSVLRICEALAAQDPAHATDYRRNRDGYLAGLDAKIAEWRREAAPLKGVKFVSYHEEWEYFAKRFGMEVFGTIELKPGIDPTPRHIEELVRTMKAEHVPVVVHDAQFPEKVPRQVAAQTGAVMVTLPIMPGGVPNTDTYLKMMDYIVHTMVNAVRSRK